MNDLNLLALAQQKLEQSKIELQVDPFDLKRLAKRTQGAVFVCNQLIPGLDEWMLMAALAPHFEELNLLNPYLVSGPAQLRAHTIRPAQLDFKGSPLRVNFAKQVVKAVEKGRAVVLPIDFSDNPLSHLGKNVLRAEILRQLRKTGENIVPIHLQAEHHPGGLLRKAIPGLPLYFPGKPVRISVRIGDPITPEQIKNFPKNRLWGQYLQAKIFSLGTPFNIHPQQFVKPEKKDPEPVADPGATQQISAEIAALPPACKVTARGQFDVYIAPFSAIPNVVFEIGRLRELTFRSVGEGSGKARDLDEFDMYYLQLIIWDREAQRVVGGYRLGKGDQIFQRFGVNGFYISSLFKLKPGFTGVLQEAVELGRSYVVPEYQKHRLPLFLMWKGILHFLLANPHYRYLYGPVSISKDYSEASKAVIVEFVKRYFYDEKLAQLVEPRKPFRLKSKIVNAKLLAENLTPDFEALDTFVESIEPAHFKVPVLFRQYLKQNARFIAFNVDPAFNDCLDGLMILDIQNLPPETIEALQQEK